MYKLSSKDINRIIVACRSYAYHTGSEWMHDEYMGIVSRLCQYLEQNFDEVDKPLECYIPNETYNSNPN